MNASSAWRVRGDDSGVADQSSRVNNGANQIAACRLRQPMRRTVMASRRPFHAPRIFNDLCREHSHALNGFQDRELVSRNAIEAVGIRREQVRR